MGKEGPPVTTTPDSREVDKRIKARIQLAFKGLDQARKDFDNESSGLSDRTLMRVYH